MINLAITAQRARGQGCWEGGDSHSRVQQQEFAEKPEDVWRPTYMDLGAPNAADNRRLEVVVDGLPLFGGVQLAVDTTLVSAVQGDGVPRRGAANRDGVALASARRKKARTYPELVAAGLVWWCWPWRWAEDGPRRPARLSSYSQRPR